MQLSNAEKLIVTMLCEVQEHFKMKGEIEPDFVKKAIYHDYLWAIEWKYHGLFDGSADPTPPEVTFVVDVLDMWSFLEREYAELTPKEKKQVEEDAAPFGKYVKFTGFDGNNETEHMSIARFMVDDLERFTEFSGREMNAHVPSIDRYQRMLNAFEPIRATLAGRASSPTENVRPILSRFELWGADEERRFESDD